MEIRIDGERLKQHATIGDFIDAEEGKRGPLVRLIALFLIDANGNYLDTKEAVKTVKAMNLDTFNKLAEQFNEKIRELSDVSKK